MREECRGYHIGDVVVFEDHAGDHSIPNNPGWVGSMRNMVNNLYVITGFPGGATDSKPWCYLGEYNGSHPCTFTYDLRWVHPVDHSYDCTFECSISDLI